MYPAAQHTPVDVPARVVPTLQTVGAPPWADRLYFGLLAYAVACIVLMLSGLGGEQVTHYVGLLSDGPACLAAAIVAIAAARGAHSRMLRLAWCWLALALGIYLIGTIISVNSWLHG